MTRERVMSHYPMQIAGPIYVLGGGPLGCHYIGEILRAKKEGLIDYAELCFVDPHVDVPAVEKFGGSACHIENTYTGFLEGLIRNRPTPSKEAGLLIPDHSAPHVLFKVFLDLVENDARFREKKVTIVPFPNAPSPLPVRRSPKGEGGRGEGRGEGDNFPKTPFLKTLDSGICAVSYAQWTCPLECEEPAVCPAIRQKRDWNFNETFSHYTRDHHNNPALSAHLFSCIQLVHGVVFIPIDHIFHEWDRLAHRLETQQKVELLVATYSKCHGIVGKAMIE